MQRLVQLAGGLSSPAILIVLIWCAALLGVAVGPIDYPGQPSIVVLTVVGLGVALFLLGYWGGRILFVRYFSRQVQMPALSRRMLNRIVIAVSLFGIVGIALVALDRAMLSGVSNTAYSELLRCAPGLVDAISIERTQLLYGGYAMFSFGFVSVVLFLLKGEEVTGWAATLAQLSIVSPVGYAVLYSGRMPILFVLVLVVVAMLIRFAQGRPALPRGHYLVVKTVVVIGLFAIYSSSIWTSRQNFCIQMSPLIIELQEEKMQREQTQREQTQREVPPAVASGRPETSEKITATDLNKRIDKQIAEAGRAPPPEQKPSSADAILATMLEAWNVKPRGYVASAIESGGLSASRAMIGLSTYFYLTHGVRTIDIAWHARDQFTPKWGVYEIGVLSPLLRVFFPHNQQVEAMEAELRAALIYGFFPTVWAAALIDFGFVGAIIYVLIWGVVAGWSAAGSKHSDLMTPLLLLVFVLASILLSVVQGPLGVANSALVLVSLVVTGLTFDFARLRSGSPKDAGELQVNSSAT
jgi:hypothetical protein